MKNFGSSRIIHQGVTLGAGFRLCLRGANANNGGHCGSSTLNVNNDVSNANGNIGATINLNTRDSYTGLSFAALFEIRVSPRPMAIHTHIKISW